MMKKLVKNGIGCVLLLLLLLLMGCETKAGGSAADALDLGHVEAEDFGTKETALSFPGTDWTMDMEQTGAALETAILEQDARETSEGGIETVTRDCRAFQKNGAVTFSFRNGVLWAAELNFPASEFSNLQEDFGKMAEEFREAYGEPTRSYLPPEGKGEDPVTYNWASIDSGSQLAISQSTQDDWNSVNAIRILVLSGDSE